MKKKLILLITIALIGSLTNPAMPYSGINNGFSISSESQSPTNNWNSSSTTYDHSGSTYHLGEFMEYENVKSSISYGVMRSSASAAICGECFDDTPLVDGKCPTCNWAPDGDGSLITDLDAPIQDSTWLFALMGLSYLAVILFRTLRREEKGEVETNK